MKIVQLLEEIRNVPIADHYCAEIPYIMADARAESSDKQKRIELELKEAGKVAELKKPFLGAKNQPLPDEVVVPEPLTEEDFKEKK